MKRKMGRPPLPKGQSKDAQIGVRLKPGQSKELHQLASKAGQTRAELVRDAAISQIQNPPIWVKSKGTQEELDSHLIEFSLSAPAGRGEGIDELKVRQNPRAEIPVDIFATDHHA